MEKGYWRGVATVLSHPDADRTDLGASDTLASKYPPERVPYDEIPSCESRRGFCWNSWQANGPPGQKRAQRGPDRYYTSK